MVVVKLINYHNRGYSIIGSQYIANLIYELCHLLLFTELPIDFLLNIVSNNIVATNNTLPTIAVANPLYNTLHQ